MVSGPPGGPAAPGLAGTDVGADPLPAVGGVSLEGPLELSSVAFPVFGSATTFRPPGFVSISPMTIDLPEPGVSVPDEASTLLLFAIGVGTLFRLLPQARSKA